MRCVCVAAARAGGRWQLPRAGQQLSAPPKLRGRGGGEGEEGEDGGGGGGHRGDQPSQEASPGPPPPSTVRLPLCSPRLHHPPPGALPGAHPSAPRGGGWGRRPRSGGRAGVRRSGVGVGPGGQRRLNGPRWSGCGVWGRVGGRGTVGAGGCLGGEMGMGRGHRHAHTCCRTAVDTCINAHVHIKTHIQRHTHRQTQTCIDELELRGTVRQTHRDLIQ